jgi:alkylation response protein AidB-like acyl-CoA dehydrogenase
VEIEVDTDSALVDERLDELLASHDPVASDPVDFLGAQFDLGLAWVHFPVGLGGLALGPRHQRRVTARLTASGAPDPLKRNPIGHGMAAPTLVGHASDDQKDRYLRPLFTGEEVWCQLFSEPGAGSDVASLSTRAVADGDAWLVNGQKVWTTLGHTASYGLLVARTDPEQPKHRGLTYFVVDMHAPGVDVRPLFQLTGEAEFNEVFLHDVRILDTERLGAVGEGWRVVLTTLMNERVSIGGKETSSRSGLIGEALRVWAERGGNAKERDRLAGLYCRAEAHRLTKVRAAQRRAAGTPGPEGSIGKLMSAELNQDIAEFTLGLLGADAMLMPGGYPMERTATLNFRANPQQAFLRTQANSIEGGTGEIMRNILGEQVLGLPAGPRADKDLPWSKVPRS